MAKAPDAFRTISEAADALDTQTHVLRFWESKFPQVKPVKRAGGRRYYRRSDIDLLSGIKFLLHDQGMTIRGVQKLLQEKGRAHVAALAPVAEGALIESVSRSATDVIDDGIAVPGPGHSAPDASRPDAAPQDPTAVDTARDADATTPTAMPRATILPFTTQAGTKAPEQAPAVTTAQAQTRPEAPTASPLGPSDDPPSGEAGTTDMAPQEDQPLEPARPPAPETAQAAPTNPDSSPSASPSASPDTNPEDSAMQTPPEEEPAPNAEPALTADPALAPDLADLNAPDDADPYQPAPEAAALLSAARMARDLRSNPEHAALLASSQRPRLKSIIARLDAALEQMRAAADHDQQRRGGLRS